MTTLSDWIEYGMPGRIYRSKAMVRRWLREARERRPVIDRLNFPDDPIFQRRQSIR